jgi:integrase
MKKTGTEVAIPVGLLFDGKGMRILGKYPSVEAFARVGSNSKVNQALKQLQELAGISTRMTFHLSRHTCATLLCYQGVPITTIQKILGHSRLATTLIYQEVMTETMVKDLKRANFYGKT